MKKMTMAAVLVAMTVTAGAHAADTSVGVDVASAYVFRGVTFNDGLVVQPYLELSGVAEFLTIGVWANHDIDDYDGAVDGGQFSEIDLYATADIPLPSELLELSAGYTEYTYPQGGKADREVSLILGVAAPLSPSLAAYYGFDGAIKETLYVEASLEHVKKLANDMELTLGATVGYVEPDEGDSGFTSWSASANLSYALSQTLSLYGSVTYIGQIDDDALPDGAGAYDVEFVGLIGISASL